MSDIVERLRGLQAEVDSDRPFRYVKDIFGCAADEIERLQRELNLLRELHHSAEKEVNELRSMLDYIKNLPLGDELDIARRAARRALEGK